MLVDSIRWVMLGCKAVYVTGSKAKQLIRSNLLLRTAVNSIAVRNAVLRGKMHRGTRHPHIVHGLWTAWISFQSFKTYVQEPLSSKQLSPCASCSTPMFLVYMGPNSLQFTPENPSQIFFKRTAKNKAKVSEKLGARKSYQLWSQLRHHTADWLTLQSNDCAAIQCENHFIRKRNFWVLK